MKTGDELEVNPETLMLKINGVVKETIIKDDGLGNTVIQLKKPL